jgi:hypothetical protein
MFQVSLATLEIAPGTVTEWRLRPVDPTRQTVARRLPQEASFNQEKHYRAALQSRGALDPRTFSVTNSAEFVTDECAAVDPVGVVDSWIATTFEIKGPLDRSALESALLLFVQRHEVLRCDFHQPGDNLMCRPLDPDEVCLDVTDERYVDSTAALQDYLTERFEKMTDILSWPLFVMGAVVRKGSTTVYLAFDHIVCDGMSMPNVVHDVASAYYAFANDRQLRLPATGSYLDFGREQRSLYQDMRADDSRLEYWKSFISRNGEFFPRFPLELGIESDELYPTINRSVQLLGAREVTQLEGYCRAAGAGMFMAILSAAASSLREAGGPDTYRGFMPISERREAFWKHSIGWFVNTMPIEFSVSTDKTFAEILGGVRDAYVAMMENVQVPFVKAWELLAPQHFDKRSWPYPVNFFSYVDFRRSPGAEMHDDLIPTMHVWAARSNGINFWFHRNTSGLHMNVIFADTPQARETATFYQKTLMNTISRVACGDEL